MATKLPSTMKAWIYTTATSTGGLPAALTLTSSTPAPPSSTSPTHLHLQTLSMSTNPVDYKIPESALLARAMLRGSAPFSPGLDFSARVLSAGSSITHVAPGDIVFGRLPGPTKFGTLGAVIEADAAGCAAAAGTAALTAWQSVIPYVKAGDVVFVNGASGGVGTYAVQLAKGVGAKVVASCSGGNAELVRGLGADEVLDYTKGDVVEQLKGLGHTLALVVDCVGNRMSMYRELRTVMRAESRYWQVGTGASGGAALQLTQNILRPGLLGGGRGKYGFMMVKNSVADFEGIAEWLAKGKLRSVIDSTFEFEDAPKAYERQKSGRARGNIVVRVTKE